MIVICVTNCSPGLKGDLSKWLSEVNTGVYIGKLSSRVREELWDRICDSIRSGQATMVYSTNNEQGYAFRTHNTTWVATDYEGITLMKRPLLCDGGNGDSSLLKRGFSKVSRYNKAGINSKNWDASGYVVMDVETTGVDYEQDRIIEVGLLKIRKEKICDHFQCFVQCGRSVPENITKLTGISDEQVAKEGIAEDIAYEKIREFVGSDLVVGYNLQFDLNFIRRMGERIGKDIAIKKTRDVQQIVRRKVEDLKNLRLETVAAHFSLDTSKRHRALEDCILTYRIYLELNKLD